MRFKAIPLERLTTLFIADGIRGELRWSLARPVSDFKNEHYHSRWYTRCAGELAGSVNVSDGYRYVGVDNRGLVLVHRILYSMYHSIEMSEMQFEVDHANRNRAINTEANLRAASSSNNKHNATLSRANTTGAKGVYWSKEFRCWRVVVCLNYKNHEIGLFDDFDKAVIARAQAAARFHKEFATDGKEADDAF